jgi:hypothetical protein
MCECPCLTEAGDGTLSVDAVKARLERSWALASAKGAGAAAGLTQSQDDARTDLDPERLKENLEQAIKIRGLLARNTEVRCGTYDSE